MNNAPLTLILIASLGIVAVISLGVFFAVRPKFAGTDEHLAADVIEQPQLYSAALPSSPAFQQQQSSSFVDQSHKSQQHEHPSQKSIILPPATPPPIAEPEPIILSSSSPRPIVRIVTAGQSPPTGNSNIRPGEQTFGQSSKQKGNQEILSTVELLDSLRVAPGFGAEQDVRATAILLQESAATSPQPSSNKEISSIRELNLEKELDMHRYGKVVGLAYKKGRLYIPSYQNGNISVYKADTLNLLKEYSCGDQCHIYDIGVLSNGDMILSQGKYSKLTKLSNKTGELIKETTVTYSTKGIAISAYDEIFVLSRDHDAVYVYDADLKQLGKIPLENKEKSDCNFLAYGSDIIYVSCESGLFGLDVQGKRVQTLKPREGGTYAIGVSINNNESSNNGGGGGGGQIYVGLRGKSQIDVYDKNGKYLETIGEKKDALWSDIVVGGKYLYVIEYITATIKQYRLR